MIAIANDIRVNILTISVHFCSLGIKFKVDKERFEKDACRSIAKATRSGIDEILRQNDWRYLIEYYVYIYSYSFID